MTDTGSILTFRSWAVRFKR